MIVNIIDIIGIITVFQLLLLGYILVSYKKGKILSHRLLSAFMFSNALLILNFLNNRLGFIPNEKLPFSWAFLRSCYSLLIPLLFLYIRSVCFKNFRLRVWHLFHTLPYLSLVTWTFIQTAYSNHILNIFFEFLHHIQIFIYSIVILLTFRGYRIAIKTMYSSLEKVNLSWLLFLFLGFIMMWFMDFTNSILLFAHIYIPLINVLLLLSLTINFIFSTGIVYCGLKQLAIFSGIDEKPKYATSQLRPQDYQYYRGTYLR
jgi:hypothetical protein